MIWTSVLQSTNIYLSGSQNQRRHPLRGGFDVRRLGTSMPLLGKP